MELGKVAVLSMTCHKNHTWTVWTLPATEKPILDDRHKGIFENGLFAEFLAFRGECAMCKSTKITINPAKPSDDITIEKRGREFVSIRISTGEEILSGYDLDHVQKETFDLLEITL